MSASGLKSKDATQNLTLSRSYIDANRRNYAFHAGLTEKKLDTRKGVKITAEMAHIADDWSTCFAVRQLELGKSADADVDVDPRKS